MTRDALDAVPDESIDFDCEPDYLYPAMKRCRNPRCREVITGLVGYLVIRFR
jgi:hypothetical protein